jgi:hypothetical protein
MKDNDREWKVRHLHAPLPPTSLDLKKFKKDGSVLKVSIKNLHYF